MGVVGPVGSGKSSLLSAILAEMSMLAGEIIVPAVDNGFGLATQEAWVQQASFRDNILFGQKYSALRFAEVLQGCALLEDLKVCLRNLDAGINVLDCILCNPIILGFTAVS